MAYPHSSPYRLATLSLDRETNDVAALSNSALEQRSWRWVWVGAGGRVGCQYCGDLKISVAAQRGQSWLRAIASTNL